MKAYIKRTYFAVVLLVMITLPFLSGCAEQKSKVQFTGISSQNVETDFQQETPLIKIKRKDIITCLQDFSDFMDYCIFYNYNGDGIYAEVSNEYRDILKKDLEPISEDDQSPNLKELTNAGQHGSLTHNFGIYYDYDRLDENLVGISAERTPYAYESYALSDNDAKVVSYEYYKEVVENGLQRDYKLQDFALYKDNKGFVEVEDSEQLWYAASMGYMPVPKEGSAAEPMLSYVLGLLNRLVSDGMSETLKYCNIYSYLTSEVTYDYETFWRRGNENHIANTSYFLEGALYEKNALCDGLVKALVFMCRLEGIEAYHIGTSSNSSGHAYSYVKIDGNYYLSCPTSGSDRYNKSGITYHYHTYSYFLTDYYTSSSSWTYDALSYPEIGEQVKNTVKYDYWENTSIETSAGKLTLAPKSVDDAVNVLETVAKEADRAGCFMQIEIKCSYDIGREAYKIISKKYKVQKINNGTFNGEKLYAFLFTDEIN